MRDVRHRSYQGLEYEGLPIHAAPGVHEFVGHLATQIVPVGGRILDLGSGSGALSLRLRNLGYEVVAMDLSPAITSLHGIDVRAGDVCAPEGISKELGKFDCVVAVELVEHLPNLEIGLRNMVGCLRDLGSIIVTTPNVIHPVSRLRFLMSGAPSYFGVDAFHETGHRNILPQWLIRLLLEEQGLQVSGTYQCGMSDRAERGVALSRIAGWVGRILKPHYWVDHGRISVLSATKGANRRNDRLST